MNPESDFIRIIITNVYPHIQDFYLSVAAFQSTQGRLSLGLVPSPDSVTCLTSHESKTVFFSTQ